MIDRLNIEIIAYHGWGYDQFCWQNWENVLPPTWKFQRFDRGYFDRPCAPKFTSSTATKIIFAHSFGLHFCPQDQLEQANCLILFSSFLQFHPQSDRLRKRSIQILDRMIEQFQTQPETVLENFYAKSCYPAIHKTSVSSNFNYSLLLEDLQQLGVSTIDPIHLEKIPNILILVGEDDRVISPTQLQQLHKELSFSEYHSIKNSGHALPFTHQQECWSLAQQYLQRSNSIKAKIAIEFGRSPVTYHQQATLQKLYADRLFSLLDDRSIPAGKILEIGCGTGFLTQKLVDRFGDRSILITDLSSEMLNFCQQNLDKTRLKASIEFRQLDGESLNSNEQYALIAAGFVVQWFQSIDSIQRLIDRLEPNGLLLVSYPSCESFPEWRSICQKLDLPFTVNPLPDSQLLAQFGGVYRTETIATSFASAADFFRSMKAIGAGFSTTGKQLTRSQMKRLIQAWDAQTGEIEVSHHIVYGVIERSR
ncbi:methyltransferase domain-containing protein [Microcoleus sp. FACHB-1515]|uniref:methyltransferase domain-containing protein n=1 Tax=Cyanophyceae TaxID=3028117 RepID=UPI001684DF90|nr:methyltransferase domain-containing protein [Microcoleus sp. FACHB-1515]MBD2088742.1 methyltransferase domain-containing protein [Microcoleus sp. FACHB-1515]